MKKLIKYITVLIVSFILAACPEDPGEPDSKLAIINNSSTTIIYNYLISNLNDTMVKVLPYPLTLENSSATLIQSDKSQIIQEPFKKSLRKNPGGLLTFFVFEKDTIAQVPWEEIVERESKLRVTQYNLEQLKALNWTITYP